jgi:hypothetical protein
MHGWKHVAQDVNGVFEGLIGGVAERGMLLLLPALEAVVLAGGTGLLGACRPAMAKLLALLLLPEECKVRRLSFSTLDKVLGADSARRHAQLQEMVHAIL